jgi:hypothetical protein
MRLGPGTLYSSIQTLLEGKLIEEVDQHEDAKLGQERRRYYRLTSGGRKLARSEAERLADLLRVARAKRIFFSPAVCVNSLLFKALLTNCLPRRTASTAGSSSLLAPAFRT